MSIGIHVVSYNTSKYILEAINSILSQTYSDFELVILDDSSTDNTYDIIQEVKDDRMSFYQNKIHSGKIGALHNECMCKFKNQHEYVCYVDSDDLIPNYCLKTFVDFMDKNKDVGVACGSFLCFDDSGKQWSLPHVANSNGFDRRILLQYMCLFPMRFYRKSCVDQVGGYSNELTSAIDYDLALKLDEITKICRIKEPVTYFYRQHATQVSKRRQEQDLNAKKALQAALTRRGIIGIVENDKPPFKIKLINLRGK
jgi:glycosyltransferase involved in cell wall biosynthesis